MQKVFQKDCKPSKGLACFQRHILRSKQIQEVSLTFVKSVSQFGKVLIESQMLIIHEVELYIEKDFSAELLSVFPSLPRLPFRFRFCVQIPDSRFRILTFPYTVNIRPRKMCRKCFRKIASLAKDLHAFRDIYLRSKQIQEININAQLKRGRNPYSPAQQRKK